MRSSAVVGCVVLACTGALLLGGCGSRALPEPTGAATVAARACPAVTEAQPQSLTSSGPERLGSDTRLAAVVECLVENRPVPGDGIWSYVVEKRATAHLDALAAALRADDEPVPWNQACTADLQLVVWFAVVTDDGTWLRPRIPMTSCGQPQPAISAALGALTWTTVTARKGQQVQTQAVVEAEASAGAAGCATAFKDLVAIESADRSPTPGPLTLGSPTGAVSVCRYRAATDADGTPMLSFVSGRRVSATTAARLAAAVAASGPVGACTEPHSRITVVQAETSGSVLVEDDGCHRVLDADTGGWGRASPALLAALARP
jgi:hypothetical protein